MDAVFPSILHNYYKPDWIRERAILASKNASVANLNLQVLRMLPGNEKSYDLINTIMVPSKSNQLPNRISKLSGPSRMSSSCHAPQSRDPNFSFPNLDSPKLCNGT
ncbi:uncharacterized protein [Palaemon carinicauda]|uniref:uncharacterized protein n=1 Tax=Palaemon carinicauda TaxID=392227 RepID=UPI0035B6991D